MFALFCPESEADQRSGGDIFLLFYMRCYQSQVSFDIVRLGSFSDISVALCRWSSLQNSIFSSGSEIQISYSNEELIKYYGSTKQNIKM